MFSDVYAVHPGTKLRVAREARRPPLSQADAAAIARIPTSRYKSYELERANPPEEVVRSLATAWGVPEAWFWDGASTSLPLKLVDPQRPYGDPGVELVEPRNKAERLMILGQRVAIPVWRGAHLGSGDECSFVPDDDGQHQEIAAFYTLGDPDRHVLCIPKGESMTPRIQSYARVLIKLDPDVPPGHLVAAQSPESKEIFIKRFVRSPDRKPVLLSVNENFDPITEIEGWAIRGGVVLILHDYEPGQPNQEWDEGRYLRA